MEQSRLFMAIILSIVVFVVWDHFFVPKKPAPQQPTSIQETANGKSAQPQTNSSIVNENQNAGIVTPGAAAATETISMNEAPARLLTLSTPFYTLKLSEKGAFIQSFTLNDYYENKKEAIKKEMIPQDVAQGTLSFDLLNNTMPGLRNAYFKADIDKDQITLEKSTESITFTHASPLGVSIIKKFTFSKESYLFNLTITIVNNSGASIDDSAALTLTDIFPESGSYGFEGPSALIDNTLEEIKTKKIKDKNVYSGQIQWIALQNRYFMSSVIPGEKQDAKMHLHMTPFNLVSSDGAVSKPAHIIESTMVQTLGNLQSGNQKTFSYDLYIGPKSLRILKSTGHQLEKAVHFGFFDILAKPCLWIMNMFYDFIPNYGLAIIFLTILVKIIFWPLGTKAYKSMNDMKKLQPLMAQINEKYKNDPQKKNQEIMALYKTYKVNPLGGCLPMIVQMPIFFALYQMLYSAIELRHASFFGWITDLSAPDRLFEFAFSIPFLQPPTGIPVLTLIMGASMFIQQKMSPPAGDPTQAKMMMMMPIFMTVIFINFSSGLVLYWLINNILSISQQYYITRNNN